jgi:hypothetical protein
MSITVKSDSRAFIAAVDRMMKQSRRSRGEVMKTQARGILKTVISITPPSNGKTTGSAAKKVGEAHVMNDILRIMKPVRRPDGEDPATIHARYRNSRGTVGRGLGNRRYGVNPAILRSYIAQMQKRVGYLVSGWAHTAQALGNVPMNAWMRRNSAPGSVDLKITDKGVQIKSTNAAKFAGNIKDMERRISFALKVQKGKIERQIENYENRLHRQTGFARR